MIFKRWHILSTMKLPVRSGTADMINAIKTIAMPVG